MTVVGVGVKTAHVLLNILDNEYCDVEMRRMNRDKISMCRRLDAA